MTEPVARLMMLFALLFPAGMCFALAWLAARRKIGATRPFVALMIAAGCWTLIYAVELQLGTSDLARYLGLVKYAFISTSPLFWLLFALTYSRPNKPLSRALIVALTVIPLTTACIGIAGDPWQLLYVAYLPVKIGPVETFTHQVGWWFYVHVAVSYAYIVVGTLALIRFTMKSHTLYRRNLLPVFLAVSAPLVVNVIYISGLSFTQAFDFTPLSFAATGVLFATSILRFRLLDLAPLARDFIVDKMSEGIVVVDQRGRVIDLNPAATRILTIAADEAIGRMANALFAERLLDAPAGLFTCSSPQTVTAKVDGAIASFEVQGKALRGEAEEPLGYVCTFRDIANTERRFRSLFDFNADAVLAIDADGQVVDANATALRLFGYEQATILTLGWKDLVAPEDQARTAAELFQQGSGGTAHLEATATRADGWRIALSLSALPMLREHERSGHYLIARDITERHKAAARLQYIANHDSLTNLPNRTYFLERLSQVLLSSSEHSQVAVLFLDCNGFKQVNDRLGHAAGDHLLGAFARRLESAVRSEDAVARMGGDEFTILIEDVVSVEQTTQVALRIQRHLERPFRIENASVTVGASIGIAFAKPGEVTATDLLRQADAAMYQAKIGSSLYCVYQSADVANPAYPSSSTDEDRLSEGLRRSEFLLMYQPIVSLATGAVLGVEALVRWRHPELGLLMPGSFLPLAIRSGLVRELGNWTFAEACRQASEWHARLGERAPFVTVNVAWAQIEDPLFVSVIRECLRKFRLPANLLLLEFPGGSVESSSASRAVFDDLHGLGVRTALDNLGSVAFSPARLKESSVAMLKLDASIAREVTLDGFDRALVRAAVSLSHDLLLPLVAQGVETSATASELHSLGCDYAQGYLFAEPLTASAATELLLYVERSPLTEVGSDEEAKEAIVVQDQPALEATA